MDAEIIAIGDELTSGQRLDTNSQWLARELGTLGIRSVQHTAVGDDLANNVAAFQAAASRADIVVCTGGLGPTLDDLTRQAMASAFDRELVLDEKSLAIIEGLFASRNREMPERNRIQAMFPAGSEVIPNPHGSAPGIDLQVDSMGKRTGQGKHTRFFALPGVPAEMKEMWSESVLPRIDSLIGNDLGPLHYHEVKVFGIGESDVEVKLPDLIRRDRNPMVGITVSRATITLRLAGRAQNGDDFQQLIAPSLAEIENALGNLVFGAGGDTLQQVVAQQLSQQGLKMACVELGCASWVGDWMLGIHESYPHCVAASQAFPSPELAFQSLGIPNEERSVDLMKLTQQFAADFANRLGADVTLLVSSYPSPQAMQEARGPFEQFYGACVNGQSFHKRTNMGGHPDVLGPRIGKTGLDFVRRILSGIPTN